MKETQLLHYVYRKLPGTCSSSVSLHKRLETQMCHFFTCKRTSYLPMDFPGALGKREKFIKLITITNQTRPW